MSPPRYGSTAKADVARLAQPLKFEFSGRVASNRLMKAAMAEALATWDPKNLEARGIPTKELIEVYRRWGLGGWGIIHTGNAMIDFSNLSQCGDPIIPLGAPFEGERFEAFKAMAAAGKANGSLMVVQVCHPGRQMQSKFGKESISASAVPLAPAMGWTFPPPRAATQADINNIVASFAHAAAYIEAAGFDGINLHAAHGYLLAQFLSPTTNKRTDSYGGSITNRMRIVTEIAAAIRKCTKPDFILSAKLNSVEFQTDGFTTADATELVKAMQDSSMDYVELSGGTYEELAFEAKKESTKKREAFFLEFADTIVPVLGATAAQRKTKVFITGGLRTAAAMVAAIDVVDGVGIGRPATQEPELPKGLLSGEIGGAMKPFPPIDTSYALSLGASSSQMRMMGKGLEPFDLTDAGVVAQFIQDAQAHHARVLEDGEKMTIAGSTDYTGEVKVHIRT